MLGSGDLKSQLENTFGLGVADPNDARYIFGDTKLAADLAKLEHPGSMLVQAGKDSRIVPAKAWWVDHSDIGSPGGIAESNTYVGPDLDAGSAAAANTAGEYVERWSYERAGHLIPNARPTAAVPTPSAGGSTAERLGLAPSKLVPSPLDTHHSLTVIDGGKPSGRAGSGKENVPSVLAAVYDAFVATRADRLHTTRLLTEPALTGMSAKRLGMLLASYGVEPCEHPFVAGGERARGYAYSDVATAVQRYAEGTGGAGE